MCPVIRYGAVDVGHTDSTNVQYTVLHSGLMKIMNLGADAVAVAAIVALVYRRKVAR